jgi:hypothetical protein
MSGGRFKLLNRAARFFPILDILKRQLPVDGSLLEIGSGALGLGEFWIRPFVGSDVVFSSRPVTHMQAVVCAGHQLPFEDKCFDAVVVSDVMEHVAPQQRRQVLLEALRVAKRLAVCGYPCGAAAFSVDQRLYRSYKKHNRRPPAWLEEHMQHPFPDENLPAELPMGWKQAVIANERLQFHYWMMRAEMFRGADYCFRLALKLAPRTVERLLQRANREPSYRKIFVFTRDLTLAYA